MPEPRIRLITRADDAGSAHEANQAVYETINAGFIRNVSLMLPGPAWRDLPKFFANRDDIALGLHVTLNSEWEAVRWGPILPASKVPSLVLPDGSFTHFPQDLEDRFDADEAMAEIEAQYGRARDLGLNIEYVDEHMGVAWLPGLRERLRAFAARENLILAAPIPSLPENGEQPLELLTAWKNRLQSTPPGDYVLVTHPGIDGAEMRNFYLPGGEPNIIARERDAERRALGDASLPEFCAANGVAICRYTDVLERASL